MRTRFTWLGVLFVIVIFGCSEGEDTNDTEEEGQEQQEDGLQEGYEGVDLLVVIDNSKSMSEEQQILATSIYTLINSLSNPSTNQEMEYPPIDNLRIAVVSSDMGLQYGDGQTGGAPATISNCGGLGDDGEFQGILSSVNGVYIDSGEISCDVGGGQCPEGFTCENETCLSDEDPYFVSCPSSPSEGTWAETSENGTNSGLTTEAACMSALGTDGCGIEQQIKAGVVALSKPGQGIREFIEDDHLLAVLVVSDEEDCSIESLELFDTNEWMSGSLYQNNDPSTGHLNTACNYPPENNEYLFDVSTFYDSLVSIKNGDTNAVVFGAIVGVPADDICQGNGDMIEGCLRSHEMQLTEELYEHPDAPEMYFYGFVPACERIEDGASVTVARPGRRYVELAELFGVNGYVYSICNADWGPAMSDFSRMVADNVAGDK